MSTLFLFLTSCESVKQIIPSLPHASYPLGKALMKSGLAGSLAREDSKRNQGVEQFAQELCN